MKLSRVSEIVQRFRYDVRAPTVSDVTRLVDDMDEGDIYDASRIMADWRAAVWLSFEQATNRFVVTTKYHKGVLAFGTNNVGRDCAMIWLLQSKTFAAAAHRHHGKAWPHRAAVMTNQMIELSRREAPTVFNFAPRSRVPNIRWLRTSGFTFFEHPRIDTDMLFFSIGPRSEELAKSSAFWAHFVPSLQSKK